MCLGVYVFRGMLLKNTKKGKTLLDLSLDFKQNYFGNK